MPEESQTSPTWANTCVTAPETTFPATFFTDFSEIVAPLSAILASARLHANLTLCCKTYKHGRWIVTKQILARQCFLSRAPINRAVMIGEMTASMQGMPMDLLVHGYLCMPMDALDAWEFLNVTKHHGYPKYRSSLEMPRFSTNLLVGVRALRCKLAGSCLRWMSISNKNPF